MLSLAASLQTCSWPAWPSRPDLGALVEVDFQIESAASERKSRYGISRPWPLPNRFHPFTFTDSELGRNEPQVLTCQLGVSVGSPGAPKEAFRADRVISVAGRSQQPRKSTRGKRWCPASRSHICHAQRPPGFLGLTCQLRQQRAEETVRDLLLASQQRTTNLPLPPAPGPSQGVAASARNPHPSLTLWLRIPSDGPWAVR